MSITPTRDWNVFVRAEKTTDDGYLGCDIAAEMVIQLEGHLRDTFPINGVPDELVGALNDVRLKADALIRSSSTFGKAMVQACNQERTEAVRSTVHYGFGPGTSFRGSLCGADGVMTKDREQLTCVACRDVLIATADKDG